MEFDLVIANGTVIDGTGQPRFRADLGIRDGMIAVVGTSETLVGHQTLDATRLVVAPGFIGVYSHPDWVLAPPGQGRMLTPLLLQSITTSVAGNCDLFPALITDGFIPLLEGFPEEIDGQASPCRWHSMAEHLGALQRDGCLLEATFLADRGTLHYLVVQCCTDTPASEEMELLHHLVCQALREEAFGLPYCRK